MKAAHVLGALFRKAAAKGGRGISPNCPALQVAAFLESQTSWRGHTMLREDWLQSLIRLITLPAAAMEEAQWAIETQTRMTEEAQISLSLSQCISQSKDNILGEALILRLDHTCHSPAKACCPFQVYSTHLWPKYATTSLKQPSEVSKRFAFDVHCSVYS